MGSESLIYLQTGAHKLISRSGLGTSEGESGHRLQFAIDPKKAHLFDPASTRRLGPEA
jgi:hypothetical protein